MLFPRLRSENIGIDCLPAFGGETVSYIRPDFGGAQKKCPILHACDG